MRRLFLGIILLAAIGCKEEAPKEDKGLLPTDLVTNPRSAEGLDSGAFASLPTMDFKDTLHDFGNMQEGETAMYDFEFTNNGKDPLIINNASGSCGCTVADYPRQPIQPGEGGKIRVRFNSAEKIGHQEKSVSISANSNRGLHTLYIKGFVEEKK